MEPVVVRETFFSLAVLDMARATRFYTRAFGATVSFSSASWSSLHIAGVRVGLALNADHEGGPTGLYFVVDDLERAGAEIERAGGHVASSPIELTPGVVLVRCTDSEGNGLMLRRT